MSEFTHLNRQFISWFGSLPPHDLMSAYENYANGAECQDRFLDSHMHALIHTEAKGMGSKGEFRIGQSQTDEYVLTPVNGKVIVRSIHDVHEIKLVFNNTREFLDWLLHDTSQKSQEILES